MTRTRLSTWDQIGGLQDRLVALVKDGGTASSIAVTLNEEFAVQLKAELVWPLTRNAILGRIHRSRGLNLRASKGGRLPGQIRPKRAHPWKAEGPAAKRPAAGKAAATTAARQPSRVRVLPRPDIAIPPALLKGRAGELVLQLTDAVCHWPEGEVGKDDFTFCGHPRWPGSDYLYCEYHAGLARAEQQPSSRPRAAGHGAGSPPTPATTLARDFDEGGE